MHHPDQNAGRNRSNMRRLITASGWPGKKMTHIFDSNFFSPTFASPNKSSF
jgi:hypothetical protein